MSALCRLLIDGCVGCGDRCFVVTWQRFHHVSRVLLVLRRWMPTVTSATRERDLKTISSRRLYILRYTLYCSSQSSSDHITDCGIRGPVIKHHWMAAVLYSHGHGLYTPYCSAYIDSSFSHLWNSKVSVGYCCGISCCKRHQGQYLKQVVIVIWQKAASLQHMDSSITFTRRRQYAPATNIMVLWHTRVCPTSSISFGPVELRGLLCTIMLNLVKIRQIVA